LHAGINNALANHTVICE